MTIGSLFAGIGGFDLAAERAGFSVAWQVEVDPFACRVLSARFPGMRRYGDITAVDPGGLEPVDILCGGWPCQGNSIAGKRAGHADERSGLFSEILRLIDGMDPRPRFLLLENVPGLLSVNGGRDFRSVVRELQGRGYVGCVRLLDAQHFGLAQRRKRLFFVCGLGAAGVRAVQSVLEGGERYPAPRREARERTAFTLNASVGRNGSGSRIGNGWNSNYVGYSESGQGWWRDGIGALRAEGESETFVVANPLLGLPNSSHDESLETYIVNAAESCALKDHARQADVARCLDSCGSWAQGQGGTIVTHTLRGEGFDASEDGTGRGTPRGASPITASYGKQVDSSDRNAGPPNIVYAFSSHAGCADGDQSNRSHASGGAVGLNIQAERAYSIRSERTQSIASASAVRRLTPTECERLQGFPDGWTCLCGRNAGRSWPEADACRCPDGPRYRSLGNAVAAPVAEWMFRRIADSIRAG